MLTKEELAPRMKVSVRTIEQWQHDGDLPFIKLGQVVLFYWPDVVCHLRENFTVRRGEVATPLANKVGASPTTLTRPADTLSRSHGRGTGENGRSV